MVNRNMTKADGVAIVARRLQHPAGTSYLNFLKDEWMLSYQEIVDSYNWKQLIVSHEIGIRKTDEATLATLEASDSMAPMPIDSSNVISLILYAPSKIRVQIVDASELFDRMSSSINSTGRPWCAAFVGMTCQYRKLATDSVLSVKAGDSANDSNLSIKVTYSKNDAQPGEPPTIETFSGTFSVGNGVAGTGTAENGYSIESISIPSGWAGDVTIEDSSQVELVKVPGLETPNSVTTTSPRVITRQLMRFSKVPDADYNGIITFKRYAPPLQKDTDYPLIPVSNVLIEKVTAAAYREQRKFPLADRHEAKSEALLTRALRNQPHTRGQVIPVGLPNSLWATGMGG